MIGQLIKAWREKEGHGIRGAAKLIGIPHSTLQGIERGGPLDGRTLIKLIFWLFPERK